MAFKFEQLQNIPVCSHQGAGTTTYLKFNSYCIGRSDEAREDGFYKVKIFK